MSLASFAVAAETTNVAGRAVELGSQTERLGLDSVWLAGRGPRNREGAVAFAPCERDDAMADARK